MGDAQKIELGKLDVDAIRIGIAGLIAVVFVVALSVDLIGGGGSSRGQPSESGAQSVVLSESELLARASSFAHPAYWIGARPGIDRYELETTANGDIYIRYLDAGAAAETPPNVLTVGTYSVPDARQALGRAAKEASEGEALSRHSGFTVLSANGAASAYLVFDEEPELQVEVYSPQAGEAAELAGSGAPTPLP